MHIGVLGDFARLISRDRQTTCAVAVARRAQPSVAANIACDIRMFSRCYQNTGDRWRAHAYSVLPKKGAVGGSKMPASASVQFFLNWAKERADEMDATL